MSLINVNKLWPAYLTAAEELRDNPEQWKVYESRGNFIVLAGPGSGKTKVLTIKTARILNEDIKPPQGVACITYNSECARELKRRLEQLGVEESSDVFIGTIHSFCLKNVLIPFGQMSGADIPYPFEVAAPSVQNKVLTRALEASGISDPVSRWRTRFDKYRRTFLDRDSAEWKETDSEAAEVIEKYEELLHKSGLIDFDDMVLNGLRLVKNHSWVRRAIRAKFPVIVVDEYQDLGVPLHQIVLSLLQEGMRILAVGDPDQSIYGFTGAKPELLIALSKLPGMEQTRLRFNYRSGKEIVEASEIALGSKRGYLAKRDHRGIIKFYLCKNGIEEQAELICNTIIPETLKRSNKRKLGDHAVLYLDKNDGDVIAKAAVAYGYEFIRIDANAPYSKTPLTRWLEDCASWCSGGWRLGTPRLSGLIHMWMSFNRLTRDEKQRQALKVSLVQFLWTHRTPEALLCNWLFEFKEACLDKTLELEVTLRDELEALSRLFNACKKGGSIDKFTVATFAGQGGSPDHLNLITLHSAKGLEFDVVIMMGMDQGRIPSWAATSEVAKREPRRLFYVGLTRAKSEIHMTYSGWVKNQYGRIFENGPSEFLLEVEKRIAE